MILAPNSKEVGDPGVVERIIIVIMIMQCRSDCMRTPNRRSRSLEKGICTDYDVIMTSYKINLHNYILPAIAAYYGKR